MTATIGLLVPDRPPTPSDGRAQHYKRPGEPQKQQTRTFQNGTTIVFGPDDPIESFPPGDAFFEQSLVIESAIADIKATLERYNGVKAASLGLDKDNFSVLDASMADRFPGHGRALSSDSIPASQIGFEEWGLRSPTETFANNTLLQPPKFSTANVYQSINRSTSPGLSHPGFSTDTRGGGVGFPGGPPGVKTMSRYEKRLQSNESGWRMPERASVESYQIRKLRTTAKDFTHHTQRATSRGRGRPRQRRPRGGTEKASYLVNNPDFRSIQAPMPAWHVAMTQNQCSIAEYYYWMQIKEQLIVVPRTMGEVGPLTAYLIDPPQPLNHPNIHELKGPVHDWAWLVSMNMNTANAGKRSQAMENILNEIIFGKEGGNDSFELSANTNLAPRGKFGTAAFGMTHIREHSDVSSVWHKEDRRETFLNNESNETFANYSYSPKKEVSAPHVPLSEKFKKYLGYSIDGENMLTSGNNLSPSPIRQSRMISPALDSVLDKSSRQSSPGYVNVAHSYSQVFVPTARSASAAEFGASQRNRNAFMN